MKKVFSILLALVMVLSFAACDSGSKDPDPTPSEEFVKVSFDTVGGSLISALEIKKGSTAVKPADPTKDGYVFDSWYYNGSVYDFSQPVNEDITLAATWKDASKQDDNNAKPDDSKPEDNKPEDNKQDDKKDDNTAVSVDKLKWVNNWYWVKIGCIGDPELTVEPESARASVKFTSSDETIATVDEKGNVKGIAGGKVTITAECGGKKTELPLTVRVPGTGITVDDDVKYFNYKYGKGKVVNIGAKNDPEWVLDDTLKYASTNPACATVDDKGNVTIVDSGMTEIIVTDSYSHQKSVLIYVDEVILYVTLDETDMYYSQGTVMFYTAVLKGVENGKPLNEDVTLHTTLIGSDEALQYLDYAGGPNNIIMNKEPAGDKTLDLGFHYSAAGRRYDQDFTTTIRIHK